MKTLEKMRVTPFSWGIFAAVLLSLSACGGGGSQGAAYAVLDSNTSSAVISADFSGGISEHSSDCSKTTAQALSICQVDVVQIYAQPVAKDVAYQMLVPGRSALVRAHVFAPANSNVSPVMIRVNDGNAWEMACPETFSDKIPRQPISNFDLSTTCYAYLSGDMVAEGIKINIMSGSARSTTYPNVARGNRLDIVLVPLALSDRRYADLEYFTSEAKAGIMQKMPFATVNLTTRGVIDLPTLANTDFGTNIGGIEKWQLALETLEMTRINDGATDKLYVGLAPAATTNIPTIAGVGYCNACEVGAADDNFSSIALLAVNWVDIMLHEVGHNLGLRHISCPGQLLTPANTDLSYPYAYGKLGKSPLYDQSQLINPEELTNNSDMMGYCSGTWFSDYSFRKIQNFMNARAPGKSVVSFSWNTVKQANDNASSAERPENWLIKGRIHVAGLEPPKLSLMPIHSSLTPHQASDTPSSSAHSFELVLTTSMSRSLKMPLRTVKFADSLSENLSFTHLVSKIDPDEQLTEIKVLQGNRALTLEDNSMGTGENLNAINVLDVARAITRTEADQKVMEMQWDAGRWPWANFTWVNAEGNRNSYRLNAMGGSWMLASPPDDPSGHWEISLSNGLQNRLHTLQSR